MKIVRYSTLLGLVAGLISCSGPQGGSAPGIAMSPASATRPIHRTVTPVKGLKTLLGPNDAVGGGGGKLLSILLCDAALPNGSRIQAINIGIDNVKITGQNGTVTTLAQYATPQVVNILQYQGGAMAAIAQSTVSSVSYASLAMTVDIASSNYVSGAGYTHPLNFVSQDTQSSSGFGAPTTTVNNGDGTATITFNRPFQISGSGPMSLDVDFNALESLVPASAYAPAAGTARPSINVASEGLDGSLSGNVVNASGSPVANAVVVATSSNGAVTSSAVTDSTGAFQLNTMQQGTYSLVVYNSYVTAAGWNVNASGQTNASATVSGPKASVNAGQISSVGLISD